MSCNVAHYIIINMTETSDNRRTVAVVLIHARLINLRMESEFNHKFQK